jgi:hypothetical protein
MKDGRRFGRPPDPFQPPETPGGKLNLTDLDSRNVKTSRGWVQGYNAQVVTTAEQIVIAAEVNVDSPDFGHLEPMVAAARAELERAGVEELPAVVLADAGYWHQVQMERLVADGMAVLVPPDAKKRGGARPGWDGGLYAFMRRVLATEHGGALYAKRQVMVEPVSPTPSSTAASTASCAAAGPPSDRNGGSPTRPTTCSSSGATQRRRRPEGRGCRSRRSLTRSRASAAAPPARRLSATASAHCDSEAAAAGHRWSSSEAAVPVLRSTRHQSAPGSAAARTSGRGRISTRIPMSS